MMRSLFPWCTALAAALAAPAQEPRPGAGIPECEEVKKTASGLEYCVLQKGRNERGPGPLDVVVVHYTGWLTDGTKFDSSRDRGEPSRFPVNGVIKGWTEGLQLMTPGARFKLTIPPGLAYGSQARGKIPADSTLVFDVELVSVVPAPAFQPAVPAAQKTTESGLKVEVVKAGTGVTPGPGDTVALRYALWSVTGDLQLCSEYEPDQRKANICGTADSLPVPFLKELCGLMRKGDVWRVEVPGKLMGERALGRMERGSPGVWEVELVEVTGPPKYTPSDPKKLVRTESGLQYEVIRDGTGRRPRATDRVRVHYTGWLTDGTLFDSSQTRNQPAEFTLNGVIKGWTEGLQLMQEGAVYQFVVPSALGYGAQGSPPLIGPDQTLVFRVELVKVL